MFTKSLVWFTIAGLVLSILNYPFNQAVLASSSQNIRPRAMVLLFDPIIESHGGQKLIDLESWNNPGVLDKQFKAAIQEASEGLVTYHINKIVEVDGYPTKSNGHDFTDEEYLDCISTGGAGSNCSLLIDYYKLLQDYGVCDLVNKGRISELWLWGGPWFGFYEAVQAGPNPITTNGPPLFDTGCERTLDIMGFSYERTVAEMLEDFAHRVEGNMDHVYGPRAPDESTPWNRFTVTDRDLPDRGGCGTAHNPVNAAPGIEYDRDNTRTVLSSCDDFLNYPELSGSFTEINCTAWGCTATGYLTWWLYHLPRTDGQTDGKLNNWWLYIIHR